MCKRLRQEAGISGTGPASVVEQSGEMKRVVDWITAAYEDVQEEHATWRFHRKDFSFATIVDTQEYTPAAVIDDDDLATWVREDIRVYVEEQDEDFLDYWPWGEFRSTWQRGAHRSQTGRPSIVTITPSNALQLWQIPNLATYTVTGEYYQAPDIMAAADASTPIIPAQFHMAIVWKALMHYGAYAAADEKYAKGDYEYGKKLRAMEMSQIETLLHGEPLA